MSNLNPMSVTKEGETFTVETEYPYSKKIQSDDGTIKVEDKDDNKPPYVNIQIDVKALPTAAGVLEFIEPDPGNHHLQVIANTKGLVYADNQSTLSAVAQPTDKAVLTSGGADQYSWVETAAGPAMFTLDKENNFSWFPGCDARAVLVINSDRSYGWASPMEGGAGVLLSSDMLDFYWDVVDRPAVLVSTKDKRGAWEPAPEEGKAVLVSDSESGCAWLPAPAEGRAVLGIQDGAWTWYEVSDCDRACEPDPAPTPDPAPATQA